MFPFFTCLTKFKTENLADIILYALNVCKTQHKIYAKYFSLQYWQTWYADIFFITCSMFTIFWPSGFYKVKNCWKKVTTVGHVVIFFGNHVLKVKLRKERQYLYWLCMNAANKYIIFVLYFYIKIYNVAAYHLHHVNQSSYHFTIHSMLPKEIDVFLNNK